MQAATPPGAEPNLTPDEHPCAQVTAYHIALTRSDGVTPPVFDPTLVNGDFLQAAGLLVALRGVPGAVGGAPMLHEPDPDDEDRGRWLPIALRRFPVLDDRGVALDEFVKLQAAMSDWEYWSLLGHIWVFSNKEPGVFNHHYSRTYRGLFASKRAGREQLMTPHERATLSTFVNPLTVFRGCQTGLNENGLSWSRDQGLAEWFAYRYYPYAPRSVLRGSCNPTDAIAYFDYDNEKEVIICGEKIAAKTKIND
jgi:hypothetical protein